MKTITMNELNTYNKKYDREDTLYYVELVFYRKSNYTNEWIEDCGDKVYTQTNDLDEAIKAVNYIKGNGEFKHYTVKIMELKKIYDDGYLHYDSVEEYEYSDFAPRKITRYEVEARVHDIVDEIADEYDVEKDFYGDCYPDEVMKLENQIELEIDQSEREVMFNEIREILEGYAE